MRRASFLALGWQARLGFAGLLIAVAWSLILAVLA